MKANLVKIKKQLQSTNKLKILSLSTTANINNAEIIFTSIRESKTTITGNILLRTGKYITEIIEEFDGFVDYFFLDIEYKNELHNLDILALKQIKKSKYFIYKPNDFTIAALDMFVALKSLNLRNKNICIIGCGNIGAKAALTFCERAANIYIFDIDYDKTVKVCEGLNLIAKSTSKIIPLKKTEDIADIDIIIGCTSGIPVIDTTLINKVNNYVIDAGNGTLNPAAIKKANEKKLPIYVLSALTGYMGMLENMINTQEYIKKLKSKKITDTNSIITPGLLGGKGDIIVDDVENITKIIAVCDGAGDVLYQEAADNAIRKIITESTDKNITKKIEQIYF